MFHLFKEPLPWVFEKAVRKPCACGDLFRWEGYEQGLSLVNGKTMMSVPGGSHWGGGVSISAMDQARIGLMLMRHGRSDNGQQVISQRWIEAMQEPCEVAPFYGYLVWLNQQGSLFKSAPKSSWFALGAGSSVTWVDQTLELVVIMRWIDAAKTNDCIDMIMSAFAG